MGKKQSIGLDGHRKTMAAIISQRAQQVGLF